MPAFLTKPANVLTVTLLLVVVGVLAYFGATTLVPSSGNAPRPAGAVSLIPTATQVRRALCTAGLAPHHLAAAGLEAAQVTTAVNNTRIFLIDHGADLQTALDSYRQLSLQSQALERRVRSGLASEQELADFAAANSGLAAAATTRNTAIAALFAAATANLPGPAVQALANIRAGQSQQLPVKYQVVARSDQDALTLRDALANDRQSARTGDDPDPACHQLLLDASAANAVVAANAGLANLQPLTTAWNSAITQ